MVKGKNKSQVYCIYCILVDLSVVPLGCLSVSIYPSMLSICADFGFETYVISFGKL